MQLRNAVLLVHSSPLTPMCIQNQCNAMNFLVQRRGLEPLVEQPKKTLKRAAIHVIYKNIKTSVCSIDSIMPAKIYATNGNKYKMPRN